MRTEFFLLPLLFFRRLLRRRAFHFASDFFLRLFPFLFGAVRLDFLFEFELIFRQFFLRRHFLARHLFKEISHRTHGLQHIVEVRFQSFQNKIDAIG